MGKETSPCYPGVGLENNPDHFPCSMYGYNPGLSLFFFVHMHVLAKFSFSVLVIVIIITLIVIIIVVIIVIVITIILKVSVVLLSASASQATYQPSSHKDFNQVITATIQVRGEKRTYLFPNTSFVRFFVSFIRSFFFYKRLLSSPGPREWHPWRFYGRWLVDFVFVFFLLLYILFVNF